MIGLARTPAKPAGEARRRGLDIRYFLYVYLHLAGFVATTLLITWGLFVLFFLMVGGLSLDGMMHQLANLASRYVAADADRIASFKGVLFAAQMLLAVGVIFFRRHRLLPSRRPERSAPNG